MNPSLLLPILLVVLAGGAVATQPAFNSQLAAWLGSPLRAALVNFLAGASVLCVLVGALAWRAGLPTADTISRVPVHLWVAGGTLGALFVSTAAWATPRIGAGAFFALVIAAQLMVSLFLDHFGLIGLEVRPANAVRLGGALLLAVGAVMVVRG